MIVAEPNDRADLLARRAYPDVEVNEAMRMLIWANPKVLGENLVVPAGTVLDTPPYEAFTYADGYQPLITQIPESLLPVSYTHLTLPTICSV